MMAKMNELKVEFVSNDYLYYTTEETDVNRAFEEFYFAMDSVGVNLDNMKVKEIVLRDKYQNDIDKEVFK